MILRLADFAGNGVTDFFEAGKVPEVREFAALLRFHGLNDAIFAFEKNARAIRPLLKRQTATIRAQFGELLDEIVFGEIFKSGEPGDFRV